MDVGLSLTQTQQQRLQMVLAPQLRQSLALLQVPILELRSLVQQEMEQNPTLEEKPTETASLDAEPAEPEAPEENKELDFKEEFEVLARLDEEWRDYFQQDQAARPYTAEAAAKRQHFFDSLTQPESLQEHLRGQLILAALPEEDHRAAEMLIGSLNDDGYLITPLEELAHSTGMDPAQLDDLLKIVQEFDPIGVGARDLKECLLLQLKRLGKSEDPAATVVRDHLDDLGAKRYAQIAKAMKVTPEAVADLARFISTLEPRPGRMFSAESPAYVLPEVQVQKVGGEYLVTLNHDQVPRLLISRHYRQLMEDPGTTAEVRDYIREKVRAGMFLIRSIQQRQQTIYRIAVEIVAIQRDFLEQGLSHLRPLTMAEIAGKLGLHETTISRAIANKYMQTPRGTFEMKYFFTPGYQGRDGQQVSNKTIKDSIARLVQEEDPRQPLSDQAIVARLKEQGYEVARRTIAKYREELRILPSHLRRSA